MKRIGAFLLILMFASIWISGCTGRSSLKIDNVWARPGLSGNNSAAFFVIDNNQSTPDRLLSASGDVAASIEVHKSVMEGGVMKMQPQEFVEVPANSTVEFKPGSYHVMLVNLNKDLKTGDRFELTLQFEKSGAKTIQVTVKDQ